MKLNNIFPNYDTFKSDVIDKLNLLFPNVEWLNEQNSYMSFQTLYGLLSLYYGDRDIRYDNAQTFINKFTFDLADVLPDIYAKQQVFINNELKTYLSSAQNRAIRIQGGTTSNRQQNNNSKAANSTTPANIVITNASELDKLPITSANLSDITLIDNINSSNEQTNFKYIDDLIKNLTSDYSLRLKEFMNLIKNHFTFIDTSNVQKECDGLYEGTRFRNGYYVSNVDYLAIENQEQIKLTNGKVQNNTINIEKLQSAIGSIPDFDNIIDTINKNTNDITKINNEQVTQNNNIKTNTTNITNNTKLINEVIEELNNSTLINYKGEWVAGTTAKLGEVWSFNNELWLCKVQQTTTTPIEGDAWDMLSSPEIDLSNYYTKTEIDQQQTQQNNEIDTIRNNQEELGNTVNENSNYINNTIKPTYSSNKWNNAWTKANEVETQLNALEGEINTNYYTKEQIDSILPKRFYKGEIRMFDTEDEFNNFNQQFNLILGQDYDVIEAGRYLLTGSFGTVGGSNYITENNLPIKEWGMDLSDHYGRYSSYTYLLQPGELKNINMTNFTQSAAGDISYSGGASIERRRFSWSYGSPTKQEFTPTYKAVFVVKFLKDIK